MSGAPWWKRLWRRASYYESDRVHYMLGDGSCPDDPRGREISVGLDFGIPTGQFDPHPFERRGPEYGSWGIYVRVWKWVLSVAIRGPIVGHYPPDEDDE